MPLIVLEGIDGCGKTTQAALLAERLRAQGREVLTPREPGGTGLGEKLRTLLLDPDTKAGPQAEALCYLAARAELCRTIIAPALARQTWVVLDRFWHSTVTYQGYGLHLDSALLRSAIAFAVGRVRVDVGLWLDLPFTECMRRRAGEKLDRIESRGAEYMAKVYVGYLELSTGGDLTRIDALGSVETVAARIDAEIAVMLPETRSITSA